MSRLDLRGLGMNKKKRIVIGTAGHIDHGKTALIRALTGTDTDRLAEEKKRGISIDLGFAFIDLSDEIRAGIVDVPGHEGFVKNMLAGATGIDMVLLVVAADDSVMPQTVEHLSIVELLGVNRGVVAVTKTDIVDEDMVSVTEDETEELISRTSLAGSPIVRVSSATGEGIEDLKNALASVAREVDYRKQNRPAFLPIDRVFSLKGIGTLITGTLWSGEIRVGSEMEIIPKRKKVRIRSAEVHGETRENVFAGERVALNVHGAGKDALERGDVLTEKSKLSPTYMIDAKLRMLDTAAKGIRYRERVRFHHGTKEAFGRVIFLDRIDELKPGESAFVQIRLEGPMACSSQDNFIVRRYSPITTIGGGLILDNHPKKHKRGRQRVIEDLEIRERMDTDEILDLNISSTGVIKKGELAKKMEIVESSLGEKIERMRKEGSVIILEKSINDKDPFIMSRDLFEEASGAALEKLSAFHEMHPRKKGVESGIIKKLFAEYGIGDNVSVCFIKRLLSEGVIKSESDFLSLPDFSAALEVADEELLQELENLFLKSPTKPPSRREAAEELSAEGDVFDDLFNLLIERGIIIEIEKGIYFHGIALDDIRKMLIDYLELHSEITVSGFKDIIGTTRKYAVPLLEYFDSKRLTSREGDVRRLM